MRFSYLRAVLICGALLDNADHASGLGQTKTVALGAGYEVDEPKHLLRRHAAADNREERMFSFGTSALTAAQVEKFNGASEGKVSAIIRELSDVDVVKYSQLVDEVQRLELTKLKSMVRELGNLHLNDQDVPDMRDHLDSVIRGSILLDTKVFLQLAQKLPKSKSAAKDMIEQGFKSALEDGHGPDVVLPDVIANLRKEGSKVRADYLQDHIDQYLAWKKAQEPA
ncbi:unnamed protein product [Hyaloperonospora brassicae]|uniref:RxLR effector protein n=1 Tax=Hyaloperonospora brassicae TaxID=162125 RepID=A0AAV0TKS5_HYABA|nr:unnamed protein product [Hyaloperonospora brassicae]